MKFWNQHKFIIRLIHHRLTRNQFLILSGVLVGLSAGTAAILLKSMVHYIHVLINSQLKVFHYPYLNLFLPLTGILITVWVIRKFLKGKDGRGVANILLDIAQRSGVIPKFKMYSQVITSAITVGFGGSSGLEGPIAVTGAAIGSNYARTYRLTYRERILLLACGAAAGIAAVFNAPITGLMFAIEVILVGVVFSDFIPLIISAVSGALISKIILNDEILFEFRSLKEFDHSNVFYYILLGVFSGLVAVYYSRVSRKIEHFFHHQLKWSPYNKAILGGLIIALLCFIFPPLFGEGYGAVKFLASNNPEGLLQGTFFNTPTENSWMIIIFTGLIFLTKVLATSFTLASGGSGGNFAPSLFTGAFMGFFFASLFNKMGIHTLPVNNFTLVGMCGVLSGVMYAPLTGIFLIAEITGGYELMIPLMLVATSAYVIAKIFEPHSMDVKDLIEDKKIFTENYDENILSLIKIHEILETDYDEISTDSKLIDLLRVFKNSDHQLIICKDKHQKFAGFIWFDKVKKVLLDADLQNKLTVEELVSKTSVKLNIEDNISEMVDYFDKTDMVYLPVFDKEVFIGVISKTKLLASYRNKLRLTLS
ncbi:chloride channel protein [Pedobacter glucosidilyticus]|uniref:chloride channel protein n=1 Tax=Pedobacter glucosidilyticus TaxID=1122941 RepID=UPI0026F2051E|nr:chloride channel protein [Pedobacter glucosidilyticus]